MCEISIGDYKLVILTTLVVLVLILNVIVIFPQFQVHLYFLSFKCIKIVIFSQFQVYLILTAMFC